MYGQSHVVPQLDLETLFLCINMQVEKDFGCRFYQQNQRPCVQRQFQDKTLGFHRFYRFFMVTELRSVIFLHIRLHDIKGTLRHRTWARVSMSLIFIFKVKLVDFYRFAITRKWLNLKVSIFVLRGLRLHVGKGRCQTSIRSSV